MSLFGISRDDSKDLICFSINFLAASLFSLLQTHSPFLRLALGREQGVWFCDGCKGKCKCHRPAPDLLPHYTSHRLKWDIVSQVQKNGETDNELKLMKSSNAEGAGQGAWGCLRCIAQGYTADPEEPYDTVPSGSW